MMPVIVSLPFVIPSFHINHLKSESRSSLNFTSIYGKIHQGLPSFSKNMHHTSKNRRLSSIRFIGTECKSSNDLFGADSSYDWEDQKGGEIEDVESPWDGAIVYQRNPSISHVEYCTTLERLGLGELSTNVSRSRASVMGLRVTKAVKDFRLGTPVLVSVDVLRGKKKLRLDGIVRTVLTLSCNRCGQPAAECVFSNFSLLLTEEPIQEPELIEDLDVMFGEDKLGGREDGYDEASIDWDDRLYFPPGQKTIDISKPIRDTVHLEITLDVVCDPMCKGVCLKCGSNLNTSTCSCSEQETVERGYGPLDDLRERMQKN